MTAPNESVPQSSDAEKAILGVCMRYRDAAHVAIAALPDSRAFYDPKNRAIFEAISQLVDAGCSRPDITLVADRLDQTGSLSRAGDRTYLAEIIEAGTTDGALPRYIEAVRRTAAMRESIIFSLHLQHIAQSASSVRDVLGEVEKFAAQLSTQTEQKEKGGVVHLGRYIPEIIQWAKGVESGHVKAGLPTDFKDLDRLLGGLQRQALIILGGRPSMGKTAMMNCVATNIVKTGAPVLVFSAETGQHSFASRSLCTMAGVDSMAMRRGRLNEDDWEKLNYGQSKMANWPYFLDATHEIDINQLCLQAKRLREKEGIEVVFVDFIQKLSTRVRFNDYRHEIGFFARRLKALASELDIPVVVGCQFSRNVEMRRDKRPILSDLKEAGKIEEEADVVIGMHRPEVYATQKQLSEGKFSGEAYAIVMKHRDGPIGEVRLYFQKTLARFESSEPAFGQGDMYGHTT